MLLSKSLFTFPLSELCSDIAAAAIWLCSDSATVAFIPLVTHLLLDFLLIIFKLLESAHWMHAPPLKVGKVLLCIYQHVCWTNMLQCDTRIRQLLHARSRFFEATYCCIVYKISRANAAEQSFELFWYRKFFLRARNMPSVGFMPLCEGFCFETIHMSNLTNPRRLCMADKGS